MFANSVLVTGANRGLGLGFIKQLVGRTQYLFAGCRSPKDAEELQSIAAEHKNVVLLELDVTKKKDVDKAVEKISNTVGNNGLNCLINNAAINEPFTKLDRVSAETLAEQYRVNAIGPVILTQSCIPLIRQASSLESHDRMSASRASVINLSTTLGSIEQNTIGKIYGYRMSKTALNMFGKCLSIELKNDHILVANLHPGWVKTALGGPNAPMSVEESVKGMLSVISALRNEDTGMFYGWDEDTIPW